MSEVERAMQGLGTPPEPPEPPKPAAPDDAAIKEEADVTAGQRAINLIWEKTQSRVALIVIFITMAADAYVAIRGEEIGTTQLSALMQLNVMAGVVISFYFSRTNHQAIGGVGPKPTQKYEGR